VRLIHPLFRQIFFKADCIQAISRHLSHFAITTGYPGPVEVIPNGVDISHFAKEYSMYEIQALKKSLGKRSSFERGGGRFSTEAAKQVADVFLITTSRLVKKNAVDDIIKAVPLLPLNVKLLILGIGPDLLTLKDLVDALNLENRVFFLGQVSHSEIPKYLKASNIFIRPSLSEGFGNSFVEAMAAGIPVIATPVGGIVDFLYDPDKNPDRKPTGLFCEPKNPESIRDKVLVLMSNRALKRDIVENAYKMVIERYDWNIITEAMREKVFRKVLGSNL
jgi:glycosyltransferase involved in cell wall biosynthesis